MLAAQGYSQMRSSIVCLSCFIDQRQTPAVLELRAGGAGISWWVRVPAFAVNTGNRSAVRAGTPRTSCSKRRQHLARSGKILDGSRSTSATAIRMLTGGIVMWVLQHGLAAVAIGEKFRLVADRRLSSIRVWNSRAML